MLSPADADLAKRDESLAGLATLLDPDAFADALRVEWGNETVESAELVYLRYKPATNCVAAYRVRAGGSTLPVYAKAHATDAGSKLWKARALDLGDPVRAPRRAFLEARGIAIFAFPEDAKLRALARLGDPLRRRRLFDRVFRGRPGAGDGSLHTLAYKPERRYVGRFRAADGANALVKFYAPAGFPRAEASCRAFESRDVLRLAERCGDSKRHHILAFEWLPGRTLRESLADHEEVGAPERVGVALAELHAQKRGKLRPQRTKAKIAKLRELGATVGFLCPSLANHVTSLSERIASRLAVSNRRHCAIHGDLYDKQILLDGDRVAIVDVDQAAFGDARSDLGLFIAHLERDGLAGGPSRSRIDAVTEALLSGYQEAAGTRVEGLEAYIAEGLLGLAHHPFRSHQPRWPEHTERILARAEAVLAGAR